MRYRYACSRFLRFAAALFIGTIGTARAQTTETEPNDSCAAAQSVAAPGVTGTVESGDVDFFRFALAPATRYIVDARTPTFRASVALLGWFNPDCTYHGRGLPRVSMLSDESGQLNVAVAVKTNNTFVPGVSTQVMPYDVKVMPQVTIVARAVLVDALTNQPLPDTPAGIQLCADPLCETTVGGLYGTSDAEGVVTFRYPGAGIGEFVRLHASGYDSDDLLPYQSVAQEVTEAGVMYFGRLAMLRTNIGVESVAHECAGADGAMTCDIVATVRNRRHTDVALRTRGFASAKGDWGVASTFQFGGVPGRATPVVQVVPADATAEVRLRLAVPPRLQSDHVGINLMGGPPADVLERYFSHDFVIDLSSAGRPATPASGGEATANVHVTARVPLVDARYRDRVRLHPARLQRCKVADCSQFVNLDARRSNDNGLVVFPAFDLQAGDWLRVVTPPYPANTEGYLPATSRILQVPAEGETLTFPPLALHRRPISAGYRQGSCIASPTGATSCELDIPVTNNQQVEQRVRLWGFAGLYSDQGRYTTIQFGGVAGKPNELIATVPAGGTENLRLNLGFPASMVRPQSVWFSVNGSSPANVANPYFELLFSGEIGASGERVQLERLDDPAATEDTTGP
jgi:hypothetical protein